MQEFKILRRKQSQEGDTGSKQEPVPVRAFNLMKMEATNVLFPETASNSGNGLMSGFGCSCFRPQSGHPCYFVVWKLSSFRLRNLTAVQTFENQIVSHSGVSDCAKQAFQPMSSQTPNGRPATRLSLSLTFATTKNMINSDPKGCRNRFAILPRVFPPAGCRDSGA